MTAAASTAQQQLEDAEKRLFEAYGLPYECVRVSLTDPSLDVAVRIVGDGSPLLFVHGSGMSAATWAPLLQQIAGHRLLALDLPGFGLSDPYSYEGRSLREHAVAQLTSVLEALDLGRARVVGTSLGAMWALCLALDAPQEGRRSGGPRGACGLPAGHEGRRVLQAHDHAGAPRGDLARTGAFDADEGARRDEERAR